MDTQNMYSLFIALHAASGTITFLLGALLLFTLKHGVNMTLFAVYAASLGGMIAMLIGAMVAGWDGYGGGERVIFTGLLLLAFYMGLRAYQAQQALHHQAAGWQAATIEHVGFTLISLFEGFVIVALINGGAAGWLVAVAAVLGVVVGRKALMLAHRAVAHQLVAG